MKMQSTVVSLAVLLLLGAGSWAAPPVPMQFAEVDTDGDGRVSAAEFYAARNARIGERAKAGYAMRNLGNAPAFEQLDGDGDGYLSELELLRGQLDHRGAGRADRGPGQGGRQPAQFSDFDRDGDGAVTQQEFDLTRAERQAARGQDGPGQVSAPSFASFDRNGDGRLTPDEFTPGRRQ